MFLNSGRSLETGQNIGWVLVLLMRLETARILTFLVSFGNFCNTTVGQSQQVRREEHAERREPTEDSAGCVQREAPLPSGEFWDNAMENKQKTKSETRGNLQWFMNKRCQNVLCTAELIANVRSRHCPATGTVVSHLKPVMSLLSSGHMLGNCP